jgi:hypothetical protein
MEGPYLGYSTVLFANRSSSNMSYTTETEVPVFNDPRYRALFQVAGFQDQGCGSGLTEIRIWIQYFSSIRKRTRKVIESFSNADPDPDPQ